MVQSHFYYVMIREKNGSYWIADERAKNHFLNKVETIKEKTKVRVYAYCILDTKVSFLVEIDECASIYPIAGKLARNLEESCLKYGSKRAEKAVVSCRMIGSSTRTVLEYCCRIHLLSKNRAKNLQDYWWSSYREYQNKRLQRIVEPYRMFERLDSDPQRALRTFVACHENFQSYYKNVLDGEK